ncbi:MAG: sensor histidine kinase, partial [Flavobacteriaceae bacterium]|nr:sensor histidine kinase [Flavobacteriaceae bacterium]
IANEKQEALLLYNCYYYQYVEALDRKENANALMLMREAISILDANKEPNLIANLQSNIGHVMLNLGELDSVLPYFDKAKAYYTKVKDTTKIAYIYNNYGNYYKTKGEYDIALEYLKSADSFPLNQEIASTKKTILKNIADTYYFKNEFEQAALSYEIWAKLSDSLDRASHTEKIQYYNTKYQTSEKERELLIEQQMKKQNRNIAIGLGGGLAAVSIFAFLVYKNTRRKQRIAEQEKELEIQKKEKILKEQELNAIDAMIAGQEKERQRLADDLHDSVGATLSAAKLQFDHIAKNRDKADTLDELFEKTGSLLEDAYTEVRSMAHLKNSGVIASKGLLPAVKKLAKNASISDGLTIEVEDFGLNEKLEGSLEISIFRIIQELVTNIIKHAQASEAQISITQHEDVLNIIVEDNGKGFNPRKKIKEDGMGLHSIEKRVEHLEGSLEVDAAPGRGTNILIDIPL